MSETHYEVLGVDADAPREEIREAYRARVAELRPEAFEGPAEVRRERSAMVNRAWNVLSDPFQRHRYDEQLRDAESGSPDESAAAPPRAPAPGGVTGARQPAGAKPPVVYENGMIAASTRARVNALSIDLAVLIVVVFGLNFLAMASLGRRAIEVSVDKKVVRTVRVHGSDVRAREKALTADELAKHMNDKKKPKVSTKETKVLSAGTALAVQGVALVLALLYTVPLSARTGQTVGKRFSRIKLVRADGSPAGWSASGAHYGLPIVVAILLGGASGLGALAALGLVGWFAFDQRRQGVHDKLARTVVVEAA